MAIGVPVGAASACASSKARRGAFPADSITASAKGRAQLVMISFGFMIPVL